MSGKGVSGMNKATETRNRNKALRLQREEERKRIEDMIRDTCLSILDDPTEKASDKLRAAEMLMQRFGCDPGVNRG